MPKLIYAHMSRKEKRFFTVFLLLAAFSQTGWSWQTHRDLTNAAYDNLRSDIKQNLDIYRDNVYVLPDLDKQDSWLDAPYMVSFSLAEMSLVPDAYKGYRNKYEQTYKTKIAKGKVAAYSDALNPFRIPEAYRNYINSALNNSTDATVYYVLPDSHKSDNAKKYAKVYQKAARYAYNHGLYKESMYFMGIIAHLVEDACTAVHTKETEHHGEFENSAKELIEQNEIMVTPNYRSEDYGGTKMDESRELADTEYDRWKDNDGMGIQDKSERRSALQGGITRAATAVNIIFNRIARKDLFNEANTASARSSTNQASFVLSYDGVVSFSLETNAKEGKSYQVSLEYAKSVNGVKENLTYKVIKEVSFEADEDNDTIGIRKFFEAKNKKGNPVTYYVKFSVPNGLTISRFRASF